MPSLSPCKFALYADDIGIYYTGLLSHNILSNVQHSIDILCDYYLKWRIKLNYTKTQSIFFTKRRKSCFVPNNNLVLGNDNITWLDNVKYLGIWLDKKLTFKYHIDHVLNRVNMYKQILYPLINRNSLLSNDNKILIFKVIFQSIILYGCPIWGHCAKSHIKRLQIAQNKILKMALKLPWDFPTDWLYSISSVNTVLCCIEQHISRFKANCLFSENPLILGIYLDN